MGFQWETLVDEGADSVWLVSGDEILYKMSLQEA
jgi:hypothetical protein